MSKYIGVLPLDRRQCKPAAVDEAAAIRAFEEHFEASAEDPSFEGELELWLTAWRKALSAQQPEARDAEIETLLAELDLRDSIIATHAADTREYQKRISQAEARGDKLAEALREARQMIRDLLPDMTYAKWDALLRDQENANG